MPLVQINQAERWTLFIYKKNTKTRTTRTLLMSYFAPTSFVIHVACTIYTQLTLLMLDCTIIHEKPFQTTKFHKIER